MIFITNTIEQFLLKNNAMENKGAGSRDLREKKKIHGNCRCCEIAMNKWDYTGSKI